MALVGDKSRRSRRIGSEDESTGPYAQHRRRLRYKFWVGLVADEIWRESRDSCGHDSVMADRSTRRTVWAREHRTCTISIIPSLHLSKLSKSAGKCGILERGAQ